MSQRKQKRRKYIQWQQKEPNRRYSIAHLLWRLMEPEYP